MDQMDQTSDGRLRPNNGLESSEIRLVDDISEENRSEASNEMHADTSDPEALLDDDLEDGGNVEDDLRDVGGAHGEFDFEDDVGHSELDEEEDIEEEDDDEDFDEQQIEGLFGSHVHPALQALGRLRNLVPPANRRGTGADSEDGYDDTDGENDMSEHRLHVPLLEALRGTLVDPRMNGIMRALRSQNQTEIVSGLNELSNLLLIPHGGLAGSSLIPVESLSTVLVNLLRSSEHIEVQVMTARAMSQLIDSDMGAGATKALVQAGLVPVMRRMFENVFYIDLIEQLIHVVKPVASLEPRLVLESECLKPCVGTLDFFNEYIQREIMAAIDACTKAVTEETSVMAKDLLAIFPEQLNDNVIGAYSALIIAIAKLNESDFKFIATETMWDNLISHLQPGTPHIARVIRAVAHIAARRPSFVQSYDLIADLVYNIFSQGQDQPTADLFGKMISTSKDILFAGLKLLQVVLPLPPAIGHFNGPYRKGTSSAGIHSVDNGLHEYAAKATPLAVAAYSASTNVPVRQLALLVIMQIVSVFRNEKHFAGLMQQLGLIQFVSQVIAEGSENMALAVGGLDIAWDMAANSELLTALSQSGITCDLEHYIGTSDGQAEISTEEPSGQFSPHDDLKPVAAYMSSKLLSKFAQIQGSTGEETTRVVESVRRGDFQVSDLVKLPLPELTRAGLLEALEVSGVENHLSDELVSLLQSAVTRLEKFELKLTGSRAKSIEEVLSRLVFVRLTDRSNNGPEHSWAVSVSAFVTVKSLEDFIRSRSESQRVLSGNPRPTDADNYRYNFWSGDKLLPRDISVFKAIQGQSGVPVINYQRVGEDDNEEETSSGGAFEDDGIVGQVAIALKLLKILAEENEKRGEVVSWEMFRSSKLTAKLTRQLSDILAIAASMLPQWTFDTIHEYPFLYPLRIRLHFVQLTSFGMGRNLRLLRQMQQENYDNDDILPEVDESNQILGRHKRQKFRLSRDMILEGALRLLEHSSGNPAVVEVMFYNEEGTGRGPTQEFFALASKAMSDPELRLWRNTPAGLYPESILEPSDFALRVFKGMGMLVARALLDKRILDFHLNPAFFAAVLSDTGPSVEKLRRVDPKLASSLDKLLDASPNEVINIGLDFTLPGSDIELLPSGKDIEVTPENLGDYVNLVCDRIVGSGIQKQVDSFRSGFSDTIPVSALRAFMLEELAALCGSANNEDWSIATLKEAFTASHGYQMSSEPVQQLLRIISSFDASERRKFLMFSTGSPHLPVGGFKALTPPFTVVIKHPDNENLSVDKYLPSVMTCANYFKLPAYSSEDIMRHRLKFAMNEGSDAFLLS